jgi:hypothetical protein
MAVYLRGQTWWYKFIYAGKMVRESAKTTRKTIALEAERSRRLELEKTFAGIPAEKRTDRIRTVNDVLVPYLQHYSISHRPKSVLFSRSRLAHVSRLLGTLLMPDLTEDVVRCYMGTRLDEGASGRTVNMELGELSRAMGKKWSVVWPKVRKLEEKKDAGKALSPEEESRLLKAAACARSPILVCEQARHRGQSQDILWYGSPNPDEPRAVRSAVGSCSLVYAAIRAGNAIFLCVSIW